MTRLLRWSVLALVLLWAWPAEAAPSIIDSVAEVANASGDMATGVTCSGSDRVLYAFIGHDALTDINFTGVNFNTSEPMTQVSETANPGTYLSVYRLIAPSATTAVVSTTNGSTATIFGAVCLSGVDQTTPEDGVQTETLVSGTTASLTVTTGATGDLILDGLIVNNKNSNFATPTGTGQTEIEDIGDAGKGLAVSWTAGAASVTSSWSWTGGAVASHIAININAAAGSTPSTIYFRGRAQVQP